MIEFSSYKEACLFGYKKGFEEGLEKGLEMSMWWEQSNCPPSPNTEPVMIENNIVESP
jgi:hypothetical protein